ncbi:MAG: hypothetical protein AABW75_03295 [Nanoarchaeota archaeon]
MKKSTIITLLIITSLLISINLISANYYSYSDKPSSYISYRESPGYMQFPKENFNQKSNANYYSTNQDASFYGYDYRGPLYERQITNVDDYSHIISSKSGFFTSKNKNNLRRTITYTLTEKYIGASESIFYNTQNNRFTSNVANQDTSYNSDGGFSFGKQRSFDAAEYSKDSYTSAYYYRPYYDSSKDYYNWRY